MSEIGLLEPPDELAYTDFPFAGIFGELTELGKELSPVGTYALFLSMCDERDLYLPHSKYGSTSITTGGHALALNTPENSGLTMGEVIAANVRTARDMAAVLHHQKTIRKDRLILPADLGPTGWTQSQFMEFWGLVIAGPDIRHLSSDNQALTGFENRLHKGIYEAGTDLSVMNSKLSREERWPHYERFIGGMTTMLRSEDTKLESVESLVSFVDPKISIGCRAERQLAQELDIVTQRIVAVEPPKGPEGVEGAIPLTRLNRDLKIIKALGGEVIVAVQGSCLLLAGDWGE